MITSTKFPWTKSHEQRYQAGRCDAHGNRMIAFDIWYLRGYFAAFESGMMFEAGKSINPYQYVREATDNKFSVRHARKICESVDRKVSEFIATRNLRRSEIAFERGREVL